MKQRPPDLLPLRGGQKGYPRPKLIALYYGKEVEVQRAVRWHAVFGSKQHFRHKPANGARNRNDDNLIQLLGNLIPGQHQNWTFLVRRAEAAPPNFAPIQ